MLSLHIVAIVQGVVFMYVFVCLGTRNSAEIRRRARKKKNLKSHQAGIDGQINISFRAAILFWSTSQEPMSNVMPASAL